MFTHCQRCGRALQSAKTQEIGFGTYCAKLSGVTISASDPDQPTLVELSKPLVFDVVLKRDGNDTTGEVITNVPWSVIDHSPTGFNWGYGGSGPADLALNILNAFVPPGTDGLEPVRCYRNTCSRTAQRLHQQFKWEFIASMDVAGGQISANAIRDWINKHQELAA